MAKGEIGTNTGTIISVKTKQRTAIEYSKQRKKEKKANKCLRCYWNNDGFCKRTKEWCYVASRGGCENFSENSN